MRFKLVNIGEVLRLFPQEHATGTVAIIILCETIVWVHFSSSSSAAEVSHSGEPNHWVSLGTGLGHANMVGAGYGGLRSFARDYKERPWTLNRIKQEMRDEGVTEKGR